MAAVAYAPLFRPQTPDASYEIDREVYYNEARRHIISPPVSANTAGRSSSSSSSSSAWERRAVQQLTPASSVSGARRTRSRGSVSPKGAVRGVGGKNVRAGFVTPPRRPMSPAPAPAKSATPVGSGVVNGGNSSASTVGSQKKTLAERRRAPVVLGSLGTPKGPPSLGSLKSPPSPVGSEATKSPTIPMSPHTATAPVTPATPATPATPKSPNGLRKSGLLTPPERPEGIKSPTSPMSDGHETDRSSISARLKQPKKSRRKEPIVAKPEEKVEDSGVESMDIDKTDTEMNDSVKSAKGKKKKKKDGIKKERRSKKTADALLENDSSASSSEGSIKSADRDSAMSLSSKKSKKKTDVRGAEDHTDSGYSSAGSAAADEPSPVDAPDGWKFKVQGGRAFFARDKPKEEVAKTPREKQQRSQRSQPDSSGVVGGGVEGGQVVSDKRSKSPVGNWLANTNQHSGDWASVPSYKSVENNRQFPQADVSSTGSNSRNNNTNAVTPYNYNGGYTPRQANVAAATPSNNWGSQTNTYNPSANNWAPQAYTPNMAGNNSNNGFSGAVRNLVGATPVLGKHIVTPTSQMGGAVGGGSASGVYGRGSMGSAAGGAYAMPVVKRKRSQESMGSQGGKRSRMAVSYCALGPSVAKDSKGMLIPQRNQSIANRYQIVDILGDGTYATVVKAKDSLTGKEVAVKVPKAGFGTDDHKAMEKEMEVCRILSTTPHKNVLQLTDVIKANERLMGTSKLMPTNLQAYAVRGGMPRSKVPDFARQIVAGMRCIHSHGIVHGDLKTDNVLVDPRTGNIKIADMGAARGKIPNNPDSDPFRSSPASAAPEAWHRYGGIKVPYAGYEGYKKGKNYGVEDVFSLGCMLLQLNAQEGAQRVHVLRTHGVGSRKGDTNRMQAEWMLCMIYQLCSKFPNVSTAIKVGNFKKFKLESLGNKAPRPFQEYCTGNNKLTEILTLALNPDPNARATSDKLEASGLLKGDW